MRRPLRALALAALTLALTLPAPSLAQVLGGITVYVDDDGTAGAASCTGSTVVPTSIQGAVDSVGPDSTIMVCPGTYVGPVLVEGGGHDGLTLRGVQKWQAVLKPTSDFEDDLLTIRDSDRVTIQQLRLFIPSPASPCTRIDAAILVQSSLKTRILANRIVAKGADTLECGYSTGVEVVSAFDGERQSATVSWNLIQDFRFAGVEMCRMSKSRIHRNSIRFLHQNAATDELRGRGIYISCSSVPGPVRITDNVITSPVTAQVTTPALIEGMFLEGAVTEVSGNRVNHAQVGIFVAAREQATVVEDNVLVGTLIDPRPFTKGIRAQAVDFPATLRTNTVSGFGTGIDVFSGTGSVIEQNDLTDNDTPCLDSSGQSNLWTGNLGCESGPVIDD